jgi:DNA-binding LacI/PurR family transcriptional regulator
VPGDVSVAGYDATPLARIAQVDLTTVGQAAAQQAERAVAAAVDRLAGRRAQVEEFVVLPHLVVRGSTGPRP